MSSIQTKPMKDRSTRPLQSQNGNSDPQNINKNQPTGEQLRIAQITSSDRSDVDPEMMKKIKEVSDLTGRSADEAWTALHDCNGDANQAVELLFEKEGEQDEWQEKKKRKKPTVVTTRTPDTATTSSDTRQERTTTDGDIDRSENIPRGQQRDRAPPRFQRGRGRGFNHSGANGEKDVSASRERGPDRRFEGGRGARRGGRGGGGVGGRGGEGGGAGRSRGGRAYNSSGSGLETVPHIDTWTNETAQNGRSDTSIGAWGDTATEEWTADEWSGSLEESLVLTRSMPTPRSGTFSAASAAAASSSDASQLHPQQHQQQTLQSQVFVPSSHAAAAADALNDGMTTGGGGYLAANHPPIGEHGTNRSVGFDLNHLLPKFSEQPYSAMTRDDESAAYLSHYTKKATECIKNAVGIGSSNLGGHGVASSSGGVDQMGRPNATQSSGAQQMPMTNRAKQQQQHHQQQQQQQMPQQHHQQQQQRPRLPPPSKIPSSAVEMPGSMGGAQLDVQFGNWDSSSAAAASSSAADVSVFLNDSAQTMSQFAGQNIKGAQQQSSAMSIGGGGGKVLSGVGEMSSLHKTSGAISINDPSSSSSVVLSIHQEMNSSASKPTSASSSASSSTSYQTNASAAAQPNDQLGNSNKMTNPQQQQQQQLSSFPTSVDDRKTIPFTSQQQQPSNQLPGGPAGSIGSSQLGLSQLAYSSGVESAPSVYKPSPAPPPPSSSSAYSQPSSAVSGPTPYGSTLHYQTTGPQTMHPTQYQVAPSTQGVYSPYGVNDQSGFGNAAPASYGAMSTQVPTGFGGAGSKPYGSVAEKPSGQFPASVLSQVYESNAYPTGSQQPGTGMQMGYQSTGAMYQGPGQGGAPAVGLSYEGLPGVASNAVYQNPANLYRQMPSNDFQSDGYPPRGGAQQGVASTAPQGASAPGKLGEGLSKLSVKDSAIISQQSYDSSSVASTSSLTSAAASASAANASSSTGLVVSSAPSSSLKTMTPATSKATAASNKTAMGNWPQSAVPAPMMNVNPNYMISQPPGFQLATFGYPTAQQTMPYPYEDLQILQQRYALPAAYYDLPLQASSALPGRDLQASLTSASYVPGSDVKLAALMDQQQPQVSVAQPPQQQGQSAGAGQQQQSYPAAAAAAAAMHPGYSYYYPPAAGMVPYYTPMIPVGGMAVPMVTNPTHGATTSSTQYQKPTLYGSHAFGTGGQSQQDFAKTFNPQASSVKATGTATGVAPSDMIVAGNAFGKSHVQGFDKVGFHSGTPPPTSYGLALASGTQGGALGQPAAIYGAPYLPMMSHQQQQTHSQLMQHAMAAQDSSMAGRAGAPQNAMQAKVGSSKTYANPYWAGGN